MLKLTNFLWAYRFVYVRPWRRKIVNQTESVRYSVKWTSKQSHQSCASLAKNPPFGCLRERLKHFCLLFWFKSWENSPVCVFLFSLPLLLETEWVWAVLSANGRPARLLPNVALNLFLITYHETYHKLSLFVVDLVPQTLLQLDIAESLIAAELQLSPRVS